MSAGPENEILVNRKRHGIRFLEDHSHLASQFGKRDRRVINILAQNLNTSFVGNFTGPFIDPVKALKERTLSATRRTDERGDIMGVNVKSQTSKGLELSIPEAEIVGVNYKTHPKRPSM
jgi:hypothetical protein